MVRCGREAMGVRVCLQYEHLAGKLFNQSLQFHFHQDARRFAWFKLSFSHNLVHVDRIITQNLVNSFFAGIQVRGETPVLFL